jgi:hypothetical protein
VRIEQQAFHLLGGLKETLALGGQKKAFFPAIKERGGKRFFERGNVTADRGVISAQAAASRRQTPGAGKSQKRLQVAPFRGWHLLIIGKPAHFCTPDEHFYLFTARKYAH